MEATETLEQLIADRTGIDLVKILPSSHFGEDLNISKLELADFLGFLEDHYKIDLHQDDIIKIETVEDLRNLIEDKLNEV